ncbi:MAG: hypothetical protein LBC97_00565 [Bifidobacteriaceae bacterium]|nr:hypothetical protein [Bifidobacteriaceae bacterium]
MTSYEQFNVTWGGLTGEIYRMAMYSTRPDMASTMLDAGADEGVVALNLEWADCMRVAGYPFPKEKGELGPVSAIDLASATQEDGTVADGSDPNQEWALLGTEPEIRIALADFDCRAQTDYFNRLLARRIAIEQRFVDQNKAELDRMVAAAEAMGLV